jgi:hypothetical protein
MAPARYPVPILEREIPLRMGRIKQAILYLPPRFKPYYL